MEIKRREAVKSTEELLGALADLRQATRSTEAAIRRGLKQAQGGGEMAALLGKVSPSQIRLSMNEALGALEKARHDARKAIFLASLDEGMSIGELGRTFGFSRQLAARYAKEARAED